MPGSPLSVIFFFFNDTATTEIYTLSLHDALPISYQPTAKGDLVMRGGFGVFYDQINLNPFLDFRPPVAAPSGIRSEEHTSELQSQSNLVCRLLLEKKKIHIDDTSNV